ncbi:hypothetical protein NDU88_002537 [Pleurodeles waltl]|uniref:Uncharacterized protein n=1 Tax=Pleurodeles waltl TaxID=8319 RepID=A0AAV7Q947_PLEWA|nr:hypothetical protein NDU88_002537 [Pleurodeles waltl]
MAVGGAAGPWGPLQCPCQWHGHCRGPRKRAPRRISVSALQTLKFATGATAPVAPSHSAGSILSRRPRGKGVSRWAGGQTFGGRPPAQWESQNDRRGLLTAERSFGGNRLAGGDRRPPRLESPPKLLKKNRVNIEVVQLYIYICKFDLIKCLQLSDSI